MVKGRPLQIVITFKTLLLAVALFLLTWAVVSIRETLLIVAVGIFLGLVFEGPVRLVERKTPLGREWRRRSPSSAPSS